MTRTPLALSLVAALAIGLSLDGFVASAEAKPKPRPTPTPTAPASPSPAPSGSTWLNGIDVSVHQGTIDWTRVAAAGKQFAFVRASAGTLTADGRYEANRRGARAVGIPMGAYHFANPDTAPNDALNEASWFLANATPASGDLIPTLDIEVANGLSATALTAWLKVWLERVTEVTGVRPMIYTSPNFWKLHVADTEWFARNGYTVLWVAHWTTASKPLLPAAGWAGHGWTFWQHSSTGSVPGIGGAVDLDRFNGSELPAALFIP
jgi:lysozyme